VDWDLFQGMDDDDRRRILARCQRRRYPKGQVLFHQGDLGDTLHLLAKGRCAVRLTSSLGDTATLTVLGPGEVFGEHALIAPASRRTASVVALEDVETLAMRGDDFEALRRSHPHVERFLVAILARQVQRLSARLVEALYTAAEVRVLRRLDELLDVFDGDGIVPVTQDELASMAGTARPTVNRVLRSAHEQGWLVLGRGRIVVVDRDRLRRLSA
jgi:CRP-like cAMP-binding protein